MNRFEVLLLMLALAPVGSSVAAEPSDHRTEIKLPHSIIRPSQCTEPCAVDSSPGRTQHPDTVKCVVYENPHNVQLQIDNLTMFAHANIIEAVIPYFKDHSGTTMQSKVNDLLAQQLEPRAVAALLRFAYSHTVEIDDSNVQAVLAAAQILRLTNVVATCVDLLRSRLNDRNVIDTINTAHTANDTAIEEVARDYISEHFAQVANTSAFRRLNRASLMTVLRTATSSDDERRLEAFFEGALGWVRNNIDQPKAVRCEVLESVRYGSMSLTLLAQSLVKVSDVVECPGVHRSIAEENKLAVDPTHPPRPQQRWLLSVPWWRRGAMQTYQPDANTARTVADTPERTYFCVVVDECDMYAIGGIGAANTVSAYNVRIDQWKSIQPLIEGRQSASAAVVNGIIYVSGGHDSSYSDLRTTESYKIAASNWATLAPMKNARSNHRLIEVDGYVYAIGGQAGFRLEFVEKYDIFANVWIDVASMLQARTRFGAAAHNGHIYVCGGWDSSFDELRTAEIYNPSLDTWTPIAPMNSKKTEVSLLVYMDKLWAIQGEESTDVYDPATDSWTEKSYPWHSNSWAMETVLVDC